MRFRRVGCVFLATLVLCACELPRPHPTLAAAVTSPAGANSNGTATEMAPTAGGCYYVWTTQDLPAASKSVNSALQAVDSQLTGSAYAYGEDCVAADGSHTFKAMETDFRIRVQVVDLADAGKIGNFIGLVMKAIASIPSDQILGAQPGRVDFEFHKSDSEELNLSVSIAKYREAAPGTSGADLFRLFTTGP